jgi:hypothetical protein
MNRRPCASHRSENQTHLHSGQVSFSFALTQATGYVLTKPIPALKPLIEFFTKAADLVLDGFTVIPTDVSHALGSLYTINIRERLYAGIDGATRTILKLPFSFDCRISP